MLVYVACMLKTPISHVYKGVSSKIRVCCASFCEFKFWIVRFCIAISMLLGSNIYAFRLQYLCFQTPISMLSDSNIYDIPYQNHRFQKQIHFVYTPPLQGGDGAFQLYLSLKEVVLNNVKAGSLLAFSTSL